MILSHTVSSLPKPPKASIRPNLPEAKAEIKFKFSICLYPVIETSPPLKGQPSKLD